MKSKLFNETKENPVFFVGYLLDEVIGDQKMEFNLAQLDPSMYLRPTFKIDHHILS